MSDSGSIRLGVMPPLTGLVAIYGEEISMAARIACLEVNESGGVLGRPLELVIEDDGSLPESAVSAAKKLVEEHRCAAIIGNLLSNSRISVAYRVAEPLRIPYLNFSFYEGSISSRFFFHFAALPNQQIDKMIPYMQKMYGPRMFFAGNNYEWPRGSIDAAKRILETSNGTVVGEEYCPIGISQDHIERLLDSVSESGADVFVPYFAGIDQVRLLTAFSSRGLKKRMAVVMGHYDEVMASHLSPDVREGFYSSNTYFMTVGTPENRSYLERLGAMPGITGIWPHGNGILTNFGEGTYLCVKAFAAAANRVGSVEPEAVIDSLETISLKGPQGMVQMDPATHHAKVNTYLSRCQADGTFEIIEHFGAIDPVLPQRYRHLQMCRQVHLDEDIRIQARMLEQMAEAAFLVDARDWTIVYANPGAERMFGYDTGELLGKNISKLHAPSDKTPEEITAEINGILYRKGVWRGETRNIKKDGSSFWGLASISAFTHARFGEVWMAIYMDVNERKQAEEALRASEERYRQAERMELIGRLSGGIAHDFNNILTMILGQASMMQMKADKNSSLQTGLDIIINSADTGAELVKRLLALGKKREIALKEVDLNRVLRTTEKLFLKSLRKEVELDINLAEDRLMVMADEGQIENAIINLALNARDAMPEGGKLSIKTSSVSLDSSFIKELDHKKYALISISDTGTGMDEETKIKIFEPFFTTKEEGKGTGLGLSMVYGTIKQHNGYIDVQSKIVEGTTFYIYLPLIERQAA